MLHSMLDDHDRSGRNDAGSCKFVQNILVELRSVRRIEEHDVELRGLFSKLFDGQDRVARDESESVLDAKCFEVCLDHRTGGSRVLDKDHVARASAQRFDSDCS